MRMSAYLVACAAAAFAGCLSCSRPQAEATRPDLSTEVSYRALWWSLEQMNGMNPNAPPPKTTEVQLGKWEYSDPIGVPHPDVVDVTVVVENHSNQPAINVVIAVGSRWSVGPMKDKVKAAWESDAFTPIYRSQVMTIAPHGRQLLKVPVDLAAKMKSLEAAGSWPWALETQAITSAAGVATSVKTRAVLPITPGD